MTPRRMGIHNKNAAFKTKWRNYFQNQNRKLECVLISRNASPYTHALIKQHYYLKNCRNSKTNLKYKKSFSLVKGLSKGIHWCITMVYLIAMVLLSGVIKYTMCITHCTLINIHASLFVWIFFGFQPIIWKQIKKKKKLSISFLSLSTPIHWCITHHIVVQSIFSLWSIGSD